MTDQPEYTGGSVSYYTCSVTHPISETADPYDAECIDIIDALQMTPNEANAFKALWRRAAARLGKSKRGYTDGLYDAEKVEFYGKRLVELERRGRPGEDPQRIFSPIPSATHRDGAGRFYQVCAVTGRWLRFADDGWFFASSDPEAVPAGLKELIRLDTEFPSGTVEVAREALKPENQRLEPIRVNCTECGEPWKDSHVCVFASLDPNPQSIAKNGFTHGNGWRDLPRCVAPQDMTQCVEVVYENGASFLGTAFNADWNTATRWRFAQPAAAVSDPFGPRDADGWYSWNGDDTMRPAGYVQIADRDGEISAILASECIRWNHLQTAGDIVKWRPA